MWDPGSLGPPAMGGLLTTQGGSLQGMQAPIPPSPCSVHLPRAWCCWLQSEVHQKALGFGVTALLLWLNTIYLSTATNYILNFFNTANRSGNLWNFTNINRMVVKEANKCKVNIFMYWLLIPLFLSTWVSKVIEFQFPKGVFCSTWLFI